MAEQRSIALGTFDGLHRGHMQVLSEALRSGFSPCALLFDCHPACVLRGAAPAALLTAEKRSALLSAQGITPLTVCFEEIRDMSARTFFEEILLNRFGASSVCCGENYHFGKGGCGSPEVLRKLCTEYHIQLRIADTVEYMGAPVSSTRIRRALQNGEIEHANAMLGRPFSYAFEVVSGDRRGRELDFPTINQFFPTGFIQPKYGVYASRVYLDGAYHAAVTNFGIRPTIGTETVRSETCILGFSGNLYGAYPEVELLSYLRPEQKFDSLAALQAAIAADSRKALEIFENTIAKLSKTL